MRVRLIRLFWFFTFITVVYFIYFYFWQIVLSIILFFSFCIVSYCSEQLYLRSVSKQLSVWQRIKKLSWYTRLNSFFLILIWVLLYFTACFYWYHIFATVCLLLFIASI